VKNAIPAALAALLALGAPAAAQPAAQTILMSNFRYSPPTIRLAAGQPVTLTFVNRSGGGHDFTAKAFFANSTIVAGAAPRGEVEVRGGATRSITLIPRAGTYPAHCSHFLHTPMGMRGTIIVQ
jgi:plastocyanin